MAENDPEISEKDWQLARGLEYLRGTIRAELREGGGNNRDTQTTP